MVSYCHVREKSILYTKLGWLRIAKCIKNEFEICHSIGPGKYCIGTMERYIVAVLCTYSVRVLRSDSEQTSVSNHICC